jgi:hypothetical protein
MPNQNSMTPNRTPLQRDRDRKRIAEMYLKMMTMYQISDELKLSVGMVQRDLTYIRQQWVKDATLAFDERKSIEVARIDWVEKEATEAWHKSKLAAEQKQSEVVSHDVTLKDGQKITNKSSRVRKSEIGQNGDPRYLSVIQKCIDQRSQIFGLYNAPDKTTTMSITIANVAPDLIQSLQRANNDKFLPEPKPDTVIIEG